MEEKYEEIARNITNVIQDLEEEGLDVRIVGKDIRYGGSFSALGFYAVIAKGKVTPEILGMADKAWDPSTSWMEYKKIPGIKTCNKTWWTTNGEDMIGELDTIYEALKRFLENREWEVK